MPRMRKTRQSMKLTAPSSPKSLKSQSLLSKAAILLFTHIFSHLCQNQCSSFALLQFSSPIYQRYLLVGFFLPGMALKQTSHANYPLEIFMRGWIEVAPDNGTYFAGFFMVGLSSCVVGGFTQWCAFTTGSHRVRPVQLI